MKLVVTCRYCKEELEFSVEEYDSKVDLTESYCTIVDIFNQHLITRHNNIEDVIVDKCTIILEVGK